MNIPAIDNKNEIAPYLHGMFNTQRNQKSNIQGDEPILIHGYVQYIGIHWIYCDSGRSAMKKFKVIASTIHDLIRF